MRSFVPYSDRFRLVWTPFLSRKGGHWLQAVGVICPPTSGCGGLFKLQVGKRRFAAQPLDLLRYPTGACGQDDEVFYLWMVPRPARPVPCRMTWHTPRGEVHRAAMVLKPARPTTVHLTFKTHLDLGYTHRIDEVIRLYQTAFMDRLLENLDKTADRPAHRRFVWTLSTWLLEQCLDEQAVKPEHIQRLESYIRQGQVVWGLMPFTTHSEFFGQEEMNRSLYAARRLAERFERPVPRAAKMTDVPAHTASLAMAFASAGGTFFQIGTNPDSRHPRVPPLFWWKLPDGQRLLCHYCGTYGSPLLPHEDWPWQEWLSIQITNDNVGPQGLDILEHADWIEQHFAFPRLRTGSLEGFADAVIRRYGRALPVVDNEFTDWWIHGISSQAGPTATAREDKDRLPSAETLATLSEWAGAAPLSAEHPAEILTAYQHLALYTEHTWGDHATDGRAAFPKGNRYTSNVFASARSLPPVDRWVASWDDKARFARRARELADRCQQRAVDAAFGLGSVDEGTLGIALFNTLSWPRGGLVQLADDRLSAGEFELVDPTTGASVLYERAGKRLEFIAPPVPACGYLVLEIRPVVRRRVPGATTDWVDSKSVLHTEDYTLQFHHRGGLARWHDRARSSQWCSGEVEHPMGAYLYEMPGVQRRDAFAHAVHSNTWPNTAGFFHRYDYEGMPQFGPVGGGRARITAEVSPLLARVAVEAVCPARKVPRRRSGDARRYRTTFTCYRGQRDLHVRMELLGKRATYGAEAGYAFFPFFGEKPAVFVDRISHLFQPSLQIARGVNAAHMAVHRGVRIEGLHAGMNFYPLHTPLVSFGRPGAWSYDENPDYKSGVLYATLFNNCWGTNFAQWQSGDFRFDFVCRPTGNDAWDGGLAKGGAEVFRPLLARLVPMPRSDASRSLLRIEPSQVQLVVLKPAEFEPGTIIRVWNCEGDPVQATLVLPASRRRDALLRCDLLERPSGRRIPVNGHGEARVTLRPCEVATFLLRPAGRNA